MNVQNQSPENRENQSFLLFKSNFKEIHAQMKKF